MRLCVCVRACLLVCACVRIACACVRVRACVWMCDSEGEKEWKKFENIYSKNNLQCNSKADFSFPSCIRTWTSWWSQDNLNKIVWWGKECTLPATLKKLPQWPNTKTWTIKNPASALQMLHLSLVAVLTRVLICGGQATHDPWAGQVPSRAWLLYHPLRWAVLAASRPRSGFWSICPILWEQQALVPRTVLFNTRHALKQRLLKLP